jgi:hypothetical protein
MLKNIIASLRWGKLNNAQKDELKKLSFKQVLGRPYLVPKLHKHYE